MIATLCRPWLIADLGMSQRVLSFAPHRPGFVTARHILWRQVRDADLPPGLDAGAWLAEKLGQAGHGNAVAMLTSCDIGDWQQACAGPVTCIATVGLGNVERIGWRQPQRPGWGTINIALAIAEGLTRPAMIEALSIVAEARTTAVIEQGIALPQGVATGTGTDCIAIAAPAGRTGFVGLHTALGEAIGTATHRAVARGCAAWQAGQGKAL